MSDFECEYAEAGQKRCPEWRCDCFIDTHPDGPFDLHPEAFIIQAAPVVSAPSTRDVGEQR